MRKSVFQILSTESDIFFVICVLHKWLLITVVKNNFVAQWLLHYCSIQTTVIIRMIIIRKYRKKTWLYSFIATCDNHFRQRIFKQTIIPFLQYKILTVVNDNIGIVFPMHWNLSRYE